MSYLASGQSNIEGFPGIEAGDKEEAATIAQVQGGRGGARLTVTAPLNVAHAAGAPAAGSGITLAAPLTRDHPRGAGLTAEAPRPARRTGTPPRARPGRDPCGDATIRPTYFAAIVTRPLEGT